MGTVPVCFWPHSSSGSLPARNSPASAGAKIHLPDVPNGPQATDCPTADGRSSLGARRSGDNGRGPEGSLRRAGGVTEKSSGRRDPRASHKRELVRPGGRARPGLRSDGIHSFPAEGSTAPRTSAPTTSQLPLSACTIALPRRPTALSSNQNQPRPACLPRTSVAARFGAVLPCRQEPEKNRLE
jgi:hypothetical protein